MKRITDWVINTFSYAQIYTFICILFVISLLPIAYFWVKTHLIQIDLIDKQLVGIREETELKGMYASIQQHRLLTQRYSREGDKKILEETQELGERMLEQIKRAGERYNARRNKRLADEIALWQIVDPIQLQKRWNAVLDKFLVVSPRESESIHNVLLHELKIEFAYLSNRVGISYTDQMAEYVLMQSILLRLPSLQESISQLVLLSEKILTNPSRELSRDRTIALIDIIHADLDYFVQGLHSSQSYDIKNIQTQKLLNILDSYITSIHSLVSLVKSRIIEPDGPNISLEDFQVLSQSFLIWGDRLWQESLQDIATIFESERTFILWRLWIILLTTLLLIICSFLLGLNLTYTGIKRLAILTQATESFTNGDLSIRIDDKYRDEIGYQIQAFNRMAQKLEELIKHLYELIDATSALASGNLTARIQSSAQDPEFDQVTSSFNKMAETFETIIGRMHQIGKILTLSASKIASASAEQETIIVDQESTTREISLAANEISSTGKDLAKTMNEVSLSAEQTSQFALKGKESLNQMESTMHHMVNASGKIAATLAVLNDKAGNITSVITTITKVADQTNLLSLNASIEAEKAGEFGRSFAVIAREIRRLADQTAIATFDIEKMINEIITAIGSSVMGVDLFNQEIQKGTDQVRYVSEQLATVIEQVQAFTSRFDIVNQGMQDQSTGAEQINGAIAQLSQTARQTTEAIHQFRKTVHELNQAANELSILNPFLQNSSNMEKNFPSPEDAIETAAQETVLQKPIQSSHFNGTTSKLKKLNLPLKPTLPKEKRDSQ